MQLNSPVLTSNHKVPSSTIDSLPRRKFMSVRNALVLFLALSTMSLLVGCGSSADPRPFRPQPEVSPRAASAAPMFFPSLVPIQLRQSRSFAQSYFCRRGCRYGCLAERFDRHHRRRRSRTGGGAESIAACLSAQTLTGGSCSITAGRPRQRHHHRSPPTART